MMRIGRGLPIGLSAVAAGLCAVIGLEVSGWRQDAGSPAAEPPRVARHPVAAAAPVEPDQHAAWLNEILARPLFSPTRHSVEVGVRGLPRLTGIIVAGSQRMAIFAGPSDGHPIIAQTGTHIGAYEVQTVAGDGVTVAGPTGISMIRPAFDASRPASPGPRAGTSFPARPVPK